MDVIAINKLQYLQIGVQGENAANSAPIDMTEWVNEYPNSNFHLLFKPYNSTSPLPMVTTYDGETHILTWTPTLSATAVAGVGYTEVRALDVDSGVLKKSRIIPTSVENSVTGVEGGTVPLPYEDWVNQVLYYKDQTLAAKDDAVAAKTAAETAQGLAETAQEAAETAQGKAEDAQESAEASEGTAEAWAAGTRDGTPVGPSDPAYENNAAYFAQYYSTMQAEASSVPYTESADVDFVTEGNHKVLKFKIPVGTPGSSDPNFNVDGQGYLCHLVEA